MVIFGVIMLIIALLLALFASFLPQDKLAGIIYFTRFFDIMIPVLAVGGLIRYLLSRYHRVHDEKRYYTKEYPEKP
jgi:hypothetical protein